MAWRSRLREKRFGRDMRAAKRLERPPEVAPHRRPSRIRPPCRAVEPVDDSDRRCPGRTIVGDRSERLRLIGNGLSELADLSAGLVELGPEPLSLGERPAPRLDGDD